MPRHPVLPPTNQYNILETFSANTAESINSIMKVIIGRPPISYHSPVYGPVYDLTQPVEHVNCICQGDSFELSTDFANHAWIDPGRCFINGVLIETKSRVTCHPSVASNYLFEPNFAQ